jgi:hypothetical protein
MPPKQQTFSPCAAVFNDKAVSAKAESAQSGTPLKNPSLFLEGMKSATMDRAPPGFDPELFRKTMTGFIDYMKPAVPPYIFSDEELEQKFVESMKAGKKQGKLDDEDITRMTAILAAKWRFSN